MITQVLTGHTSPETAYVVADYPYGFRLRCQIRYWIETKKGFGQRVMSQTSNPKRPGVVWNKPKGSTYSLLRVLFLDEQGYVQNDGLSPYVDAVQLAGFEALYGQGLTDSHSQAILTGLKAALKRRAEQRAALAQKTEEAKAAVAEFSEPHTIVEGAAGLPNAENDPVGRFRLTDAPLKLAGPWLGNGNGRND